MIKHRSGIASAQVYWTTDPALGYQSVEMILENVDEAIWVANIPNPGEAMKVYYYIHGTAESGKSIVRPLPAPEGYFSFSTGMSTSNTQDISLEGINLNRLYPNPSNSNTQIEVTTDKSELIELILTNALGQEVKQIFRGKTNEGINRFVINTEEFTSGIYVVQLKVRDTVLTRKLIIE